MKRQVWQPSPEYINNIKTWLLKKNCKIYEAIDEADYLLIELEKKGVVDMLITCDSDLLILGSSNIVKPISPIKGVIFNKESICNIIGFTAQQWQDFMYLCKNMKENDVSLAYSFVSVYKDLEVIQQKYFTVYQKPLIPDSRLELIL